MGREELAMKTALLILVSSLVISHSSLAQLGPAFRANANFRPVETSAPFQITNIGLTSTSGWAMFMDFRSLPYDAFTRTWTCSISGAVWTNSSLMSNSIHGLYMTAGSMTNLLGVNVGSNAAVWICVSEVAGNAQQALLMHGSGGGNLTDGFHMAQATRIYNRYLSGTPTALSDAVDNPALPYSLDLIWANGTSYTNGIPTGDNSSTTPFANSLRNIGDVPGGARRFSGILRYIVVITNYGSQLTAAEALQMSTWGNTNMATNITSGLASWHKFDENTGTNFADSSGNGWGGILGKADSTSVFPVWTNAEINAGLGFSGNAIGNATHTNYAVVTNSANLANTNAELTISLWVRFQTNILSGDQPKVVMSKVAKDALPTDNRFPGWEIHQDDSTISAYFSQSNSASGASLWSDYLIKVRDAQWHHYLVVKDSTGTNLIQYMDGVRQADNYISRSVVTNYSSTNMVMYGWNFDSAQIPSDKIYAGDLDDARIYYRAFTSLDALALFWWGKLVKSYQ